MSADSKDEEGGSVKGGGLSEASELLSSAATVQRSSEVWQRRLSWTLLLVLIALIPIAYAYKEYQWHRERVRKKEREANQLLLDETFRGAKVDDSTWLVERSLASDVEGLQAYTDDPAVVFVRDSRLIIQPRPMSPDAWTHLADYELRNEHAVENGELDVDEARQDRGALERPNGLDRALVHNRLQVVHCTVDPEIRERIPEKCDAIGSTDHPLPPVVSAQLSTRGKFEFTYGTLEVRLRLPRGEMLRPAISLRPMPHPAELRRHAEPWPYGGEIDVMTSWCCEADGLHCWISSAVHCVNPLGHDHFVAANTTLGEWIRDDLGFVTVGLERRPGYLRTYVRHNDTTLQDLIEWPRMGPACYDEKHAKEPYTMFDVPMYVQISLPVGGARSNVPGGAVLRSSDSPGDDAPWDSQCEPPACHPRTNFREHSDELTRTWTRPFEIDMIRVFPEGIDPGTYDADEV